MRKLLIAIFVIGAVAGGGWMLARSRTIQLFGTIVPRVETSRPVVALTFDDGPAPEHTAEVLELLKAKNVRGTFFLIGGEIERHPQELERIIGAGHEVGNHSWSHQRMVFKSPGFIRREIESTDHLIRAAGYRGPIHFRSPYCKKLIGVPWYLAKTDRTQVTFDVEPESDPEIDRDPKKIAAHVIENARPGSIVLLHVMYGNRSRSRAALPLIIDALRARGYEFATVSDLIALGKT